MNLRRCAGTVVVAAWLAAGPASAAESSKDVRVVNAPGESVPVTATGTVGLAPGTRVDVANAPGTVLQVLSAESHRQVFLRNVQLEWIEGASNAFGSIEVPAGKRLVIEQVGARFGADEGQSIDLTVDTSADGHSAEFLFPMPAKRAGHGGLLYAWDYRVTQSVRLYHDGDGFQQVRVGGLRSALDRGHARGTVTVSGYLVDLP